MKTYLADVDPSAFDVAAYVNERLPNYAGLSHVGRRQARIAATKDDPLLWALIYFSKTLTAGGEGLTLADMHFDLCRLARHFRGRVDPLKPLRYAFIAPRRAGKTSWLYKILAFWMAAHKHRTFFLTLTGTGGQAQKWITNWKMVMEANQLLREDYPELCTPRKRESTGRAFADDTHMYAAESGFVIAAQGTDGNGLGLNFDDERPDMLLFDDIEPPGGSYSVFQMNQRLTNVLEGAIPMGMEGASILFVGTVLMPGSIMDQLRTHATKPDPKSWISQERIKVRHYKPFVDKLTGEQTTFSTPESRSFWEGRHKLANLLRMEGTRKFAAEYANEPLPETGAYWREGDIKWGTIPASVATVCFLSIDPAVSNKKKSDFTALAIIRYAPSLDRFEVLYGRAFKLNPGVEMPQYVASLLAQYPEVTTVLVEDNQGKDLWEGLYGDIPGVALRRVAQSKSKTHRAAEVLAMCQTGQVVMSTEDSADVGELVNELYSFPKGLHDDLPDSMNTGVLELKRLYGPAKLHDSEGSYV